MRIDLFRAGSQVAMNGQTIEFTETDLAASAAAYDPAKHEAPIVIGHPKTDNPAYGWVQSLAFAEGEMAATGDQVEPAFAELVRDGRYKKVSASFYPPGHPANPVPEVYYLKHVGFLGAVPPAIKGLKAVEFAEDDANCVVIEFAENRAGQVARAMAEAWGQLRDWMIGKYGLEEANKAMSPWSEDWLRTIAAEVQAENNAEDGPRFAEAFVSFAEALIAAPLPVADPAPAAPVLDPAVEAAFAERERKLVQRETELAERQAETRRTEDAAVLDGLVQDGRLAPGWRAPIASFLERQDNVAVVSFSEGEEAETPRAFMLRLLAAGGVVVDFSELSPRDPDDLNGGGDNTPAVLAARIAERVAEAKARGEVLSYSEAATQLDR